MPQETKENIAAFLQGIPYTRHLSLEERVSHLESLLGVDPYHPEESQLQAFTSLVTQLKEEKDRVEHLRRHNEILSQKLGQMRLEADSSVPLPRKNVFEFLECAQKMRTAQTNYFQNRGNIPLLDMAKSLEQEFDRLREKILHLITPQT